MEKQRPYGIWPIIDMILKLALPIICSVVGYLFSIVDSLRGDIRVISERQQKVIQWKDEIPQRMQVETEKLKLQILAEVAGTLGAALSTVREGQVEIKMELRHLSTKLDEHMTIAKEGK